MDKADKVTMIGAIILTILAIIVVTPHVTAQEIRFITQERSEVNITQTCTDDGLLCADNYACNVTVINPSQNIIIDNQAMQDAGSYYNYTLGTLYTRDLGTYQVDTHCTNTTSGGTETFFFKVTPTGDENTTAQGIMYLFVLILSLVVFGLCLYGSIKIPFKNRRSDDGFLVSVNDLKHVKLILGFVTYTLFVWLMWIGWQLSEAFLFLDIMGDVFRTAFYFTLVPLFPALIITTYMIFYFRIKDLKLHKLLSRGLQPR